MIIVRLCGGLGNQMFQYALGHSLSKSKGVDFRLDIREFEESYDKNTPRLFELSKYNILGQTASQYEISRFRMTRNSTLYKAFRKILMKLPLGFCGYFKEKFFYYDERVNKSKDFVYLDGYWQSYKYFQNDRSDIVKQFKPVEMDDQNSDMAQEISGCNAVSLHIRRGDYVTNSQASQHHGTCNIEYYYKAVRKIEELGSLLHFYIFSDDPQWVQENLKLNHPVTIMDFNGMERAHIDMFLMSLCRFHIVANSSFSWWGAWLCSHKNKQVFAPANWFKSGESTKDLIPDSWERL